MNFEHSPKILASEEKATTTTKTQWGIPIKFAKAAGELSKAQSENNKFSPSINQTLSDEPGQFPF